MNSQKYQNVKPDPYVSLMCHKNVGAPVIAEDGTIYVVANHRLFAINPNGTIQWSDNAEEGIDEDGITIGDNEIIYVNTIGSSVMSTVKCRIKSR